MKALPFYIKQLIFAGIIALIILACQQIFPGKYVHHAVWGILSFFICVNLLLYYMAMRSARVSSAAFMNAVFGSIGIKLFLCIFFIIIYLINDRTNSVWFIINFLLLYLFFTVFEIYSLLHNLRALKK
jgi:hypothetical protein